ncbi:aldo/keto reductase [Aquincola sp. S2]|uniref:Aldo/keto reductase n=1 Tax=Pseudaquabacterium terrae TaxID=2732868 RepID=A0ABX2EEV3_9BURK|nr:aldo/keto reductase [Aquabacterium terrae]NRF67133.1 aldo/keto reductase [Aquabacterium terrae]
MKTLALPGGATMPAFGLGTWRYGEQAGRRSAELTALRDALALGYRLFDTAEMYGEGGAETLLGQAIADALRAGEVRRDELFIVSKVYPHNASRRGVPAACERSLKRLQLERIDLYLLHWRGEHPLAETAAALQDLVAAGHIAHWGVSNLDVDDLEELAKATDPSGAPCAANQVYYSLGERGPEAALLPWQRARGLPLMAYSPIDQGALAAADMLGALAQPLGLSAAQLALAWVLAQPGVVAIPKTAQRPHLRDNLAAAAVELPADVLAALDRHFPPPKRKRPLAMI